ncbi:MAG: tetratricopeptide repeat protein [Lachnospiraceae bacterium]|nr:tetratricopeptide repeat protein [Lachnospiraceae bacterium]
MTISYRTKGNSTPTGKNRVYFTCHKDDFESCFDKICSDIFATQDCAVYYTEDMSDADYEYMADDLGQMNLFVIPVSMKLLTEPNRAMDVDFRFAMDNHIPVLPIALEPGLEIIFSRPDKFGKLQYLDVYSMDDTAISYEEKLKKFLASVLVGEELAEKVRSAFDAYVFLSYRKKDRTYANNLMRLIHKDPFCRDVAIWYDEYLKPGEDFEQSIADAMSKSDMFAFLITPNITEEGNYVQQIEYPEAKKSGKGILPVEMVATDHKLLSEMFTDIPECVAGEDSKEFYDRFIETLGKLAKQPSDNDPEHNFLIGIAYRDGIDVEVDKQKGVELITKAAEADVPEAMEALINMYRDGMGVERNYALALQWSEKIVEYYSSISDPEDNLLNEWIHDLAVSYLNMDRYEEALARFKQVYEVWKKTRGENEEYTLTTLSNIGILNIKLGHFDDAIDILQKTRECLLDVNGGEDRKSITDLLSIASVYQLKGEYAKAMDTYEKAYASSKDLFGDDNDLTLIVQNGIALTLTNMTPYDRKKAAELEEQVCDGAKKNLGCDNPLTLLFMSNLANIKNNEGFATQAADMEQEAYDISVRVLGEEHLDTISRFVNLNKYRLKAGEIQAVETNLPRLRQICDNISALENPQAYTIMSDVAFLHSELGHYSESLEINKAAYDKRSSLLGEDHSDTILSLNNIAADHIRMGDYAPALEPEFKVYEVWGRLYDDSHPYLQAAMQNLALIYRETGEYDKAVEFYERLLKIRRELYKDVNDESAKTISIMHDYAATLRAMGNMPAVVGLQYEIYLLNKASKGETNVSTLIALNDLALAYYNSGNAEKALEINRVCIELMVEHLGQDAPDTLVCAANMQVYYDAVNNK